MAKNVEKKSFFGRISETKARIEARDTGIDSAGPSPYGGGLISTFFFGFFFFKNSSLEVKKKSKINFRATGRRNFKNRYTVRKGSTSRAIR